MSELKHWLDETSEADEFERAILRAGLQADPPDGKRDQIWSGLMDMLAVAPLAPATTTAKAASTKAAVAGVSKAASVGLAVAKGFLVGLALYGAAAGVGEISNRLSAPQARALPAQRASTPTRAPSSGGEALAATSVPPLTPAIDDAPSTPRAAQRGSLGGGARAHAPMNTATDLPSVVSLGDAKHPSSGRVSQLEAEAHALRRARDELRAGKLADAFAILEASQRQFSAPELDQEREALMIELLSRSGQVSAAEQRAKAFLSHFPESPHAQQIQRFTAK